MHHIEPRAACQQHDPLKMIVLCANCPRGSKDACSREYARACHHAHHTPPRATHAALATHPTHAPGCGSIRDRERLHDPAGGRRRR
ncbi:MAG: hypothetical protein H3C42_07575 [Phycisphaerae bacterium]|nr:hypothetical protein [Phycisphaerae bacterium]NUQ46918.1 hypothetical protein [Phycisphaerae bacterium]